MDLDIILLLILIFLMILVWFTKFGNWLARYTKNHDVIGFYLPILVFLLIGFWRPIVLQGVIIAVIGLIIIHHYGQYGGEDKTH